MKKLLGKIIIVTKMRKIPRSCSLCGYYDSMGQHPGGRRNYGVCTARATLYSTERINVSKERLDNCPLRMIAEEEL